MRCSYPIADYPVYRFSMPVVDSSMYLVPGEKTCLIVDPCVSEEAEALLRNLGIRDCLILLTHEHFDHISGVNWLRERLHCRVVCSEKCAERMVDPRKNCAAYSAVLVMAKTEQEQEQFNRLIEIRYACHADQTYSGQAELQWADLRLTLMEMPGHSPGSQIVEVGGRWYFTGDSLIPGQEVITRLPGGSKRDFAAVTRPYLERIAPGSIVFPGHGAEAVFSGLPERSHRRLE